MDRAAGGPRLDAENVAGTAPCRLAERAVVIASPTGERCFARALFEERANRPEEILALEQPPRDFAHVAVGQLHPTLEVVVDHPLGGSVRKRRTGRERSRQLSHRAVK